MTKFNKLGMSDLVSIVLLIMISVTLVIIVFVYITDFSKNPALLSPQSCIDIQANPSIIIRSACYNPLTKDVEAVIFRQVSNFDVSSLRVRVFVDDYSESWQCSSCGSCSIPDEGESGTYYFGPLDSKPQSLALTINDCAEIKKKVDDC